MIFVNARDSRNGAQERTRTSTTLRPLAPEASASASSATWAQARQFQQSLIFSRGLCACQLKPAVISALDQIQRPRG